MSVPDKPAGGCPAGTAVPTDPAMCIDLAQLPEDQLELALREKLSCLTSVVAGVAHEVNSPLGAVAAMHDNLSRAVAQLEGMCGTSDAVDEARLARLHRVIDDGNAVIRDGLQRVMDTVENLERFVSLDGAHRRSVDVSDGLRSAVNLLRFSFHQKSIDLDLQLGEVPPVWGYPALLNQAFAHLILNAVQAMGRRGRLTVHTALEGDEVVVVIADDGPGMPPEFRARTFEPGFTTKAPGVGTGLGLATVKRSVERHGGRVEIRSEAGSGTRVEIRLPAAGGNAGGLSAGGTTPSA